MLQVSPLRKALMAHYAAITGWGMAVPQQVLTNADLERTVATSSEWIRTRTGIGERHIASPTEHSSVLATQAGRQALARANLPPRAVELVILATCTPDRLFPATACTVQANLDIPAAGAFDLTAACSGFVYGLSVATNMIRSGGYQTVLLLAVDLFSRIVNWRDRNTSILFGDGAGAVVLQAQTQPAGLLADVLGAAGKNEHLMFIEAGGTRSPLNAEALEKGQHLFTMRGPEVFKQAVRAMSESSLQALAKADLTSEQVKLVIPHQANLRIIEAVAERLKMPMERVFVNIERYGNTSAASVPIALCEAADQGLLHEGDNLLLTTFGGGLSWASGVVRWGNTGKNRR